MDRERNSLMMEEVITGSHKWVWWKCEKGHSWQAMVFSVALDGLLLRDISQSAGPRKTKKQR